MNVIIRRQESVCKGVWKCRSLVDDLAMNRTENIRKEVGTTCVGVCVIHEG